MVCGEQHLPLSPHVSLFMAPRDSGIGNELDLELDEDCYDENMDEERWGGHTACILHRNVSSNRKTENVIGMENMENETVLQSLLN